MTAPAHNIEAVLGEALGSAAAIVQSRLGRAVQVLPAAEPEADALLRFDVTFGGEDRLGWLVSNADAIGLADLLIGGAGDRAAQPTEIHLDALSGLFSDLLEQVVAVLGGHATGSLAPGGVDMGMEAGIPPLDEGGVQAVLALDVAEFGQVVIVQQVTPGLAQRLADATPTAAAQPATPEPAAPAPEAAAAPAPEQPAAPAAAAGDAPVDQSAIDALLAQAGVAPDAEPAATTAPGPAEAAPEPQMAAPEDPPTPAGPAPAQPAAGAPQPPAGTAPPANVVDLGSRRAAAPEPASTGGPADLAPLLNVPLPITVELGSTQRTVRDLIEMGVGTIMELQKLAGDPLDIKVHDRVIARGEVVVIDEEFGIRVTEIVSPEQRLRGLGS